MTNYLNLSNSKDCSSGQLNSSHFSHHGEVHILSFSELFLNVGASDGEWAGAYFQSFFICTQVSERTVSNQFNQVQKHDHIYATDDHPNQPADPHGHQEKVQVNMQKTHNLAVNLTAMFVGKLQNLLNYFDEGDIAMVDRNYIRVAISKHKIHLKGPFAFFTQPFIHRIFLVRYNNKLKLFFYRTIALLSKGKSSGMISRISA